jgi:hypothetical protein
VNLISENARLCSKLTQFKSGYEEQLSDNFSKSGMLEKENISLKAKVKILEESLALTSNQFRSLEDQLQEIEHSRS